MFEKNLQDLVKGIRSTKGDVSVYISQSMQEIKNELKSTDQFVKAQAVRKLTFLHMLGYDMCWAAFHVVEVMSYERFAHKRIGYTAACQSFTQSTDVILLCTNLLKKEFSSINEYEVGLAINVLSNIVTTDLGRDLLGDIIAMMNSPKPYVRKKATLVMYKVFLRYPQGLRVTFDKLKERMEEPDVSVVSCAVNVICELANKKPKNYLGLAPQFFRLLTTSSNNWMLIKVVKLMASLVPEEPRLARKLLDPLATIIQNTPAKSLLYECISTVTTALLYTKKSDGSQPRNVSAVVRLCNDHLRKYIEDPDQNLRYLGLVGLSNLMQSHPYVIMEHQELIVQCLAVDDITIRMRSLELLAGMVNPDNAAQIIRELMRQTLSADGAYRHELITRILHVCSINKYENIHDFDWYIHVLVQLARVPGHTFHCRDSQPATGSSNAAPGSLEEARSKSHGVEVARQLVDIAVRVKSVRSVIVENMIDLLLEKEALIGAGASTLSEVFYAAAWISGEYIMEYLEDEEEDDEEDEEDKLGRIMDLVDEMLQPRTTTLPAHVQTVFIQNLLKFIAALADKAEEEEVEKLAQLILERIPTFVQSEHIEVQERAICLKYILLSLGLGLDALTTEERANRAFDSATASVSASQRLDILNSYFAERLAPVGAKAQRKVPLPSGLDLDEPIDEREASYLEAGGDVKASYDDDLEVNFVNGTSSSYSHRTFFGYDRDQAEEEEEEDEESSSNSEDAEEEKARQYAKEKERLRKDPFYLNNATFNSKNDNASLGGFAEIMDALDFSSMKKKKDKGSGSKKKSRKSQRAILEDELMPEGARSSDEDKKRNSSSRKKKHHHNNLGGDDDDADLSAIDLSVPLGEHEKIPDQHLYHRQVKMNQSIESVEKNSKEKRMTSTSSKKKKKEKTSKSSSKSSSKQKKHDEKKHHRNKKESKENIYLNVSSNEEEEELEEEENEVKRIHHKRSSSHKDKKNSTASSKKKEKTTTNSSKKTVSSSKSKEDSIILKEKKKKKKRNTVVKDKSSSKKKQQQDEPLLLL